MASDDLITEHLKAYHCGESLTVSSKMLEMTFQMRGPELRRILNRLRSAGVPICSTDQGYYYAKTEEELQHTIRQLRSRIKKISHAERGLTKALRQFSDNGQMSLPLDGGDSD